MQKPLTPPVNVEIVQANKMATPDFIRYLIDLQNHIKRLENEIKKLKALH